MTTIPQDKIDKYNEGQYKPKLWLDDKNDICLGVKPISLNDLIFTPEYEFIKTLAGGGDYCDRYYVKNDDTYGYVTLKHYEYHLQQLSLLSDEDKVKYIKEMLCG